MLQTHSAPTAGHIGGLARLVAALLALLAPTTAFGQPNANVTVVPAPEPIASERVQRFEIGVHAVYSEAVQVSVGSYYYAGASATYALRDWFALGTEIDVLTVAALGSEPDRWRDSCPDCVWSGVQTLALGELRLPLIHDAVFLFGRAAMGPAFVTRADGASSVVLAARSSVGVDLHLGHVYARPFVLLGALPRSDVQLGFGLEVGAVF